MTKYIYIFCTIGIVTFSAYYILIIKPDLNQEVYHGIDITSKIELPYSNGNLRTKILRINKTNLDGFWTQHSTNGRKIRTQFYICGILDTSWSYNPGQKQNIDHDTSKLFQYISNRISVLKDSVSSSIVEVNNTSFLNVPITRSYKTYLKNGNLNREILFTTHESFDGFWCIYDNWGNYTSTVVINGIADTTLSWWKDLLLFEEIDVDYPSEILFVVGGHDVDSTKIVNDIRLKMQSSTKGRK